MGSSASTWRGRAAVLALLAGAVSVAVRVLEGPPGSGYGWGSVLVSAGLVAGLFLVMAYLVRYDTVGPALVSAAVAILVVVVVFAASLIGNWEAESAASLTLDTPSTFLAVAASVVAFIVAVATMRHSEDLRATPSAHSTTREHEGHVVEVVQRRRRRLPAQTCR